MTRKSGSATSCFLQAEGGIRDPSRQSCCTALPMFLTSNKVWIATDRSPARRCVEACVYGTLDFVGYRRFPAPVELITAVIPYYVHPVNIQTACLIMQGAELTEHIIIGVDRPVKAA